MRGRGFIYKEEADWKWKFVLVQLKKLEIKKGKNDNNCHGGIYFNLI